MIRVEVQRAVTSFGTEIYLVEQESPDGRPQRILHLEPHGGKRTVELADWSEWAEYKAHEPVEAALVLPDDVLRALCDALTRYFTGTEDTRQLRCDYEAERRRTDKLIDHIATIARSLAEPQP